ncbi:hypothetical protein [Streptomyces turgidiscabies]|uniref:hypothetical protein n=1 Tax=Streptomyces turgidiscabies TaxID=85558 RepID=UPI0038F7C85B
MADQTTAEDDLAQRLAHNDGWLHNDDSWERAGRGLRKDYLGLARETLTVLGGPTEAQQRAAELDAEARELRRQRDRYRDAWRAACHGRAKLRGKA